MRRSAARRPLVGAPILIGRNESTARLAGGTVEIGAPAALLRKVTELCNGERTREEVESALAPRWKRRDVLALLDALEEQGVLVDSTQAALAALKLAENPMRFAQKVSDEEAQAMARAAAAESLRPVRGARYRRAPASKLTALLHQRRSIRSFSGEPLGRDDVLAVLWAAYGVTSANAGELHKTVASGGALFPLRFHLIVLDRGGRLEPGVYSAHFGRGGKVGLKRVSRNWRPVYRAYVDPELVRYAQAVLVVSGDFRACAGKYANRALLYVPLEAGHAVQNALLAATERGLGSVQIGGFIDEHLGRLIGSPKGETPLSTVVLGAAGPAVRERQPRFQFDWVDLGDADGRPFYLGVTRLLEAEDRERYCWGRDPDPLAAYDKAAAEGFERLACITPAGLIRGRLGSLRGAIDPREVLSYSPQQYARRRGRLRPFDPGREYWWKAGIDRISGKKVHVLGELVHYGPTAMRLFGQRCYWSATSSGVAAHLSAQAAFEAALLELIERDAFMRAWLGRAPTPQIAARTFPAPIQGRLRHLEHLGARVMLKALPSDLAAVVLVFAQFEARATTVVTAAAAYNPVMALDKALMETESVVFGSLESGSRAPIRPEEVTAPLDHAALYSQARYFRRADFLAGANGQVRLSELARGKPRHLEALLGRLAAAKRRAVQIDLRFPEAALGNGRVPLYIVRAIVPGLIPITFGFDCEPLGTARLSSNEPLFPHPFS